MLRGFIGDSRDVKTIGVGEKKKKKYFVWGQETSRLGLIEG